MKFLKEWIDERRNEEDINYFDYNGFNNLEEIDDRSLKKANCENQGITVALKNLNNLKIIESDFIEFIAKLKAFRNINHSNVNRFLGLTKDSNGNDFSILEYANEGNLRDYLKSKFSILQWNDKIQMALDITNGLMCLHSEKIIHGNLHAYNVLVNNGILKITDSRLFKQVAEVTAASENIVYIEPQSLCNSSYERDMKSDIYSLGVLLWELSSGRAPFSNHRQGAFSIAQIVIGIVNGQREEPVENTPLEYLQLYQKCWQGDPNLRPEINEVYETLSHLKLQLNTKITTEIFQSSSTTQQIIRQFKMNHGLILNEYNILPSTQAIIVEDGELKINLYKRQPLVYTCINSEDNITKPLDTCINFPIAEIIYNGNLLESFLECTDDEKRLHELFGQFLAGKFLVGGQLFIKEFNSATRTQIDILKFYLFCTYNSVKYSTEIRFNNLFTLNLLPEIETLDGEKLNTHEKLANWMNNLYQKKMIDIISYDNLIPISQLKHSTSLIDDLETFNERQPGVANFNEKLSLEEWVGDAVNDNLLNWTIDFDLFQGLIFNKNNGMEISKKVAVNIIEIPKVNLSNKSCLEMIKPSTKLKVILISNNIFSIHDLSSFQFIENNDVNISEDYIHFLIKCEQYEILLNKDNIKPTKEFEQAIEKALDSMKPLKAIQDVFNEYGHLFPQRIILGRSLRNILPNNLPNIASNTFGTINLKSPIFESLKSHLDNLNISYLLTQKRRVIGKNDILDWIQNTNHLEIIEFDDIIPLYKILKAEQQKKIDMLNNNFGIIMTGFANLKDLDDNNVEHYKRINVEPSLEDEDYEVFGSIISKDNSKLEEIYVNFGLYDVNGFYAIIKNLKQTSINISNCYVLWVIVGKPTKLSLFSPNNRDFQVKYFQQLIRLQPNQLNYCIKTSSPLSQGYAIFVHAYYPSSNYEPNNIVKLVKWKEESIYIRINNSIYNSKAQHDGDDIDLRICILSTGYKSLKIDDKKERECSLDLIGYILTEENFDESLNKPVDRDEDRSLCIYSETSSNNSINSITSQSLTFQDNLGTLIQKSSNKETTNVEMMRHLFDENSGSSTKKPNTSSGNLEYNSSAALLLKLEEDGFITPDEKVKGLITELTGTKALYALKLLFENLQNKFSSQVLIDSLKALADPTLFDHYSKEIVARLELHLRTLVAVLEQIYFSLSSPSPIVLSEELQDKVYNSLAKFAEIHYKTTQIIEMKKHNYNIDFLLIHLRDTLHSLCDNKTWFQELLQKVKDLLKIILNIIPSSSPKDNCSTLSIFTQLYQELNFKYPVASYYIDWRIILIIQYNLFNWTESNEKIISKNFGEMILMEYFWSYLEREWINNKNNTMLDSQAKFDETSNKLAKALRNSESFLNDLAGNEPLVLPDILWFGILDLAQNLIQKSTQTSIYGLCYYLAIESLNKASSSFIQFKAIEILLHLYNINNESFSMIEIDFDQYTKKLDESNSKNFQNLLLFVKEKYLEDFNILNDRIVGKGKGKEKEKRLDQNIKKDNTFNILNIIADEITCSISNEPTDQLYILKCQHLISLNYLTKLRQKRCPICQEKIDNNDIRYLPQNTIYKNLYPSFFEAEHILPSIELEDFDNQDENDSNSEVDLILTKKINNIKEIRSSNKLLQSIFQAKKHPVYQNVIKELEENNYDKAILRCQEYLKNFPKNYSIRCILAYIYRCLNNYEQALLYLYEAIKLKEKNPIAWYISGEIYFRKRFYDVAIQKLKTSIIYKVKSNNIYILLGFSYLFKAKYNVLEYYNYYKSALNSINTALQNDSSNYLCLKNCSYSYEKLGKYLNTLEILDKLLNINQEDSLILCYYGEILNNMGRYNDAIIYFTKANIIDPENIHNLNKRAIVYFILQEYDKALLDINKVIQLDFLNNLAYYYKGLIYFTMGHIDDAMKAFEKCIKIDSNDNLAKMQFYFLKVLMDKNCSEDKNHIITKINQISNIDNNKSLLFIRCKIYIELKKYPEAKLDLERLFELDYKNIEFVYLLQQYSNFWTYLCEIHELNNNNFNEIGIINKFNLYMYKVKKVYFISNLINLDNIFYQFQENNSLLGQVLSIKNNLKLPKFSNILKDHNYCITWKINIKTVLENCFIKFIIKSENLDKSDLKSGYILKYEDILKIEKLGWIEYNFNYTNKNSKWVQFSIEADKIDMQIAYVKLTKFLSEKPNYFFNKNHLLPFHKIHPNIPEVFQDKYFLRKEMENLLDLKDIVNNL